MSVSPATVQQHAAGGRGLVWTRNEDVSESPESLMYCLELPVAVIYVKRGSGCLVGTEQSGDQDHPDQARLGEDMLEISFTARTTS